TDPRTLMFAHGLAMGLFEEHKLRWLTDQEWEACGYMIEKEKGSSVSQRNYVLTREPLRRFEDIPDGYPSVEIVKTKKEKGETAEDKILDIIQVIKAENPTVVADDIGVIFVDGDKSIYLNA